MSILRRVPRRARLAVTVLGAVGALTIWLVLLNPPLLLCLLGGAVGGAVVSEIHEAWMDLDAEVDSRG